MIQKSLLLIFAAHKKEAMHKVQYLFLFILLSNIGFLFPVSAQTYWQQNVDYTIDVRLDDVLHELTGTISMQYTNNSPDELSVIYMHLWPNAYQNNSTAFAKQELENKSVTFQYAAKDERGYIDGLDWKVNVESASFEYDSENHDYGKLILPSAIKSGQTITITTPFHVKIPASKFSRLGHSDNAYQLTQWYPKPAVYDAKGWHPIPYLNQGEFYSEYGNYTVNISVPSNYVIGASGDLQTQSEIDFLNQKAEETLKMRTDNKDLSYPESSKEYKTIQYKINQAHDFAWFADKRFHVLKGEVILPYTQRKVTTYTYFTNLEADLWMKSIEYVNRAVLNYSEWVGEYQWNVCQALEGALSAGEGMEYPTITIIGESGNGQMLDNVITHEVGHNWFYGMFGFNERRFPWMDEGINSYYENRYMEKYYPGKTLAGQLAGVPLPESFASKMTLLEGVAILNSALEKTNKLQAIDLPAADYTSFNYGTVVYMKTAYCFNYLASYLGQNNFDRAMSKYFTLDKMQHSYPEDMQKVFEEETGEKLDWFFKQLLSSDRSIDYALTDMQIGVNTIVLRVKNNTDILAPFAISLMDGDSIVKTDWQQGFGGTQTIYMNRRKGQEVTAIKINADGLMPEYQKENNTMRSSGLFKKIEPLQLKLITSAFDNPDKTSIFYSPVFGANANDGFMLGLALYNSTFPMPGFEYVFAPMYAFGSQNLSGQGSIGINLYPDDGFASRWRISTSGYNYTYYKKTVTDSAQAVSSEYFDYTKLENKIEVDLRKQSMRTSPSQTITFRNILINEEDAGELSNIHLFGDGTFKMFNELNYQLDKKRVLFPYQLNGTVLFGDGFTRLSAEGKIKIHYPKMKQGIDIRLFAGKFFGEDAKNNRYSFSVGSVDGYHDFLYDEIFFSRNVYGNFWDSQVMMWDGFMKSKNFNTYPSFNYSNDMLAAVNLELSIPKAPFLALYADAVYYSTSDPLLPQKGNMMYDAGAMIKLIDNVFEIYFPLLESSDFDTDAEIEYSDKISFMLNINALNVFEVLRKL